MQAYLELAQLDGMLDIILDLQDASRAREWLRHKSLRNRKQAYPVDAVRLTDHVSSMQRLRREHKKGAISQRRAGNSFHEWSDNSSTQNEGTPAIAATICQTASVVTGSTIKLRL